MDLKNLNFERKIKFLFLSHFFEERRKEMEDLRPCEAQGQTGIIYTTGKFFEPTCTGTLIFTKPIKQASNQFTDVIQSFCSIIPGRFLRHSERKWKTLKVLAYQVANQSKNLSQASQSSQDFPKRRKEI